MLIPHLISPFPLESSYQSTFLHLPHFLSQSHIYFNIFNHYPSPYFSPSHHKSYFQLQLSPTFKIQHSLSFYFFVHVIHAILSTNWFVSKWWILFLNLQTWREKLRVFGRQADEIQFYSLLECTYNSQYSTPVSIILSLMRNYNQNYRHEDKQEKKRFTRYAKTQEKGERANHPFSGNLQERNQKSGTSHSIQQKNSYYPKLTSSPKKNTSLQDMEQNSSKSESVEYQRFNERLHSIEDRISELKVKLEKKKHHKEKKDSLRQKIIHDRKTKQDEKKINESREVEKGRKKKSSTKLQLYISKEKPKKPSFKIQKLGGFVTQTPDPQGHPLKFNPYSPRNNIYYISEILKGYKQQDSIVREHLINSIEFLGIFTEISLPPIANRKLNLSHKSSYQDKITVVFDLDETLIHCNDDIQQAHDIELPIVFPTGQQIMAGINIRPGAQKILEDLAKSFEVIVFTASHPCYANVVLDYLDPNKEFIQHRLYRHHCYLVPGGGPYVKDLRILNRDEKKLVLIDNAAYSYAFQPDNGIPIIPYYQGQNDFELSALKNYLNQLRFVDDVRQINRKVFKLRNYPEYSADDVDKMVQELYGKLNR